MTKNELLSAAQEVLCGEDAFDYLDALDAIEAYEDETDEMRKTSRNNKKEVRDDQELL